MNKEKEQEDNNNRLKVVVLGDTKTGKTTFLDSKKIIFLT